ncbi:hypothetical protein GCM10007276_25660 [Agaricicola taiwanensis]|uniref:VWA domain-containing protein n=1 Tax=Agaricicola taiwanensis TaxID=591372 RepID=A0A8J2YJC1_9RHOB|nr:VWA domain-containing protein [Agaricicola taiwanensis]GGE47365.1 hypothetical protein GCM10007276_25660 [Agaricicola taiwanensis]
MAGNKTIPAGSGTAPSRQIADFVQEARSIAPAAGGNGLIFALDATMSRQPTWDRACLLQAGMFDEAAKAGGLHIQLVYYRGLGECRASRWAHEAKSLKAMMEKIDCRGGHTQLGRVLRHAAGEAARGQVKALAFVGDAFEESLDDVCAAAGEVALRAVPVFLFQEGSDPVASRAFKEIARLTRGAHCVFDGSAADELGALLRAVAAYAAGGVHALKQLAERQDTARLLLARMG